MSGAEEKVRLTVPILVEGKYDKARLVQVADAVILTTDGFAVFRNEEKRALIRKLGARGVIILADSDGGGRLIRSHLRGMLGEIPVWDLYTPAIRGKEPRKASPSKEGVLGVEGVPNEILRDILRRFAETHPECAAEDGGAPARESGEKEPVTRALLYRLGLNGGPGASEKRARAAEKLGLPRGMTVNAFLAAAGMLTDAEGLAQLVEGEGLLSDIP